MIGSQILLMFITSSIFLCLAPGVDNIFVLTQSILHGVKSGIIIILGLCTGLVFHTIIVAFGVTVIFQTSQLAFDILRYTGGLYLLHLAIQSFRVSSSKISIKKENKLNFKKLYIKGIIMNVTNPKVILFFLAFLPQFTNEEQGLVTFQIIIFGITFIIISFFIFSSIAFLAGAISKHLNNSIVIQRYLNIVAGFVFTVLASLLIL